MSAARGAGWAWDPAGSAAILEAAGYGVDTSDAVLPGGGSLSARRDREGDARLVALDAGGRFRATMTSVVEETSRGIEVAGIPTRATTRLERRMTLTGVLQHQEQLALMLQELDQLPPSASS